MSDKYKVGLDQLAFLETDAVFHWALVKMGFPFNADHAVVDDLEFDLWEISGAGYQRVLLEGGARTVNTSLNRIDYRSDWPQWAPLTGGQTLAGAVLIRTHTDDTDSIPIAHYPFEPIDAGVIAPFLLRFIDQLIGFTT